MLAVKLMVYVVLYPMRCPMLYACSAKADGVCCPMRCPMLYACAWVAIIFVCTDVSMHFHVCVCVHVCTVYVHVCVCVCYAFYSACIPQCYKSAYTSHQSNSYRCLKEWVTKTSLYRCILSMGSY